MYFKRMEIHGFKSFAEHVNVEFHPGITCIVGPNGSGKSNISDALKWVLGEQSPKTLRGNKMEDVIFAGTSTRKSRGMAEVNLIIDNTSKFLPIDFSEVSITRRMYRSGESEYYINNNQCRLKDIKELIMDTGIGVDGYSIIGQGKIIEIINGKPEERRKIFEEVAGIVKYRTKKSEAERKLESTNQNLLRVNDIISELESRIDPLRIESEKAKEYLELKESIKIIEINLTIKNIEMTESKIQGYKEELQSLMDAISKLDIEKKEIEVNTADYKIKNEQIEKESQEIQEKLMVLVQDINSSENNKKINEEKLSSIEKDIKRIKEEICILDKKLEAECETKNQLLEKKESTGKNYANLLEEQKDIINTYNERSYELNKGIEKVEEEKSKVIELYNLIAAKKAEVASIENLKNTLLKRKNQILDEKEINKNVNDEVINKYNQVIEEKQVVESRLNTIHHEQSRARQEYNEHVHLEKQYVEKLDNIKNRLNEAVTRNRVLRDMDNTYEGFNHAVKVLMKSPLVQSGIHGVVADLIEVPEGFEVAIETALGQALQNIVCQSDESAKKSIDYLKKNNAGRITFLPVESIRPIKRNLDKALEKVQGFKGLAVECIKYNSIYSNIMEYLLGRVVIVDNLDNAIKMSKNTYPGMRIVTMEGDVINSSGAITGGSYKNNSGNILVRKTEARKLSELISQLEEECKKQNNILNLKRDIIKGATETLNSLEKEYKEKEASMLSIDKEIHKYENDMNLYRDTELKFQREVSEIENEETQVKLMTENLMNEIMNFQKEAASIEVTTQENMKQYDEERQKIEEMSEKITDFKLKIASAEHEKSNIDENITRIERYIHELHLEKENKNNNITELGYLKASIKENNIYMENLMLQQIEDRRILEELKSKKFKEKEQVSKMLEEGSVRKDEIDKKIYHLQLTKHDIDLKLTKSETQIDSYKDKLWDEFEVSYIQAIKLPKEDFKYSTATKDAKDIRDKLKQIGEVNVGSIKEYETVKERFDFLSEQRADLLEAISSLKQIIEDMDKAIKINFKDSFNKVAQHFEVIFQDLFGGGMAELKMDKEDNLLETGIEIVAQPPGKKLQSITLLSGGEKTLTAIALMFAILKVKPTPFCIMDEVEAALDETNIYRFASYLKKFNDIQFVLVTHQKATMEFADILYGVTMPEQGISKVLSLKLEQKVG